MNNNYDFLSLAADRYSVRKFRQEPVEQEKLDLILKAGHLAPTGCNLQPQKILIINSEKAICKMKECTKCHFDAPAAMLVCYNKDECWTRKYDNKTSGEIDASIVCTHMMLEAANIGIGSTWVMYFDPDKMRKEFHIPDKIEPVALLVMGYPADDAQPFPGHSEFKAPEDIVVYNEF